MENGGPITKTEENFWFDGIHDWGEKKEKKRETTDCQRRQLNLLKKLP